MLSEASRPVWQVKDKHRDIVRDLIRRLPITATTSGREDWTIAVKNLMHGLCRDYLGSCRDEFWGTHFCNDFRHREWLLDAVWYVKRRGSEGMLLALESEWADNSDEVCSDFSKVLSVKAPIKIILFEAGKESRRTAPEQIAGLTELCRNWCQHSLGDVFYAINFHDGEHETHCGEAFNDGEIPMFSFLRDPELSGLDSISA